ncbi:MAG: solute:Na+ symporter, family [Chthoniobacter sp.]|jgi:SSS family transporter|nr:solute:Na+ symporter, family [Chthoniobacter sp.]
MNGSLVLDALVLIAYFGAIIGVGLAQRSKSDSVEGFSLGDRQIAWWAVLASILAAEISAATFLGAPGEGYANRNWTYAQLAIGTVLARIFVSFVFIPIYYRHGVISIYEFLETRFGQATRKLASATFLVTRVLAMGTRLYVSAIIVVLLVEMLRGGQPVAPMEKFALYAGALVVVSLLTALYTTVGGIRAVIWTDFIQVGVLVASLAFTIPFLLGQIPGGWDEVRKHIAEPIFFDFVPRQPGESFGVWLPRMFSLEYTIYAAFLGSTFVTMATHGIDQDTVQRMLTAKNRRQSAFATILSGIVDLPIVGSFILIGLLLFCFYQAHPTPGLPEEGREVFPYFILHTMPAGLRGLVTAGILATAMGSLSTALNALATSFARDFVLPWVEHDGAPDEARRVRILRWSTVLFAVLIIVVGVATAWYMAHNPAARIIPLVLGILGFTFGSLLGIFLVGLFTKRRGSDLGNTIAVFAGILAVLYASGVQVKLFGAPGAQPAFVLAFPWRITLGTLVTFAVAVCFRTPAGRVESARIHDSTHT